LVVSIEKAVVSRLTVSGQKFEILVDPEKALRLKRGERVDMREILAYPAVYKDVRSTDLVSLKDLEKVFGTSDIFKVAEKIVREGELQLTTEQRRKMIEEKKNQIITLISKRGINPQTHTPHPPERILAAMEKARVKIDPFKDAELQIENVLQAIRPLLPIKFEKVFIQIKIPPPYAGKAFSIIKNFGEIKGQEWLGDGSLKIQVKVLAGMQTNFFEKISNLTHGNFESKILKRE
jgi:ribosome maturation protein SDO1